MQRRYVTSLLSLSFTNVSFLCVIPSSKYLSLASISFSSSSNSACCLRSFEDSCSTAFSSWVRSFNRLVFAAKREPPLKEDKEGTNIWDRLGATIVSVSSGGGLGKVLFTFLRRELCCRAANYIDTVSKKSKRARSVKHREQHNVTY